VRGGSLHKFLVEAVRGILSCYSFPTACEVWVHSEGFSGFIDLTAVTPVGLLAVEVELTARRITSDVRKAQLLTARHLWIVVPTATVRQGVLRVLQRLEEDANTQKCVLTLGQVPQRLTHCFPLNSTSNGLSANKKQIGALRLLTSQGVAHD
jgi:hypothetical protein